MWIDWEKKEVHFCNPSLEELANWLAEHEEEGFKIMIDEHNENTDSEWGLYIS
jgi:hypothetical protein